MSVPANLHIIKIGPTDKSLAESIRFSLSLYRSYVKCFFECHWQNNEMKMDKKKTSWKRLY